MKRLMLSIIVMLAAASCRSIPVSKCPSPPVVYNVRCAGASGDGKTLDSPAINRAIEAANKNGGGTVWLGAGDYLCASIHLKSNVCLYLEQGATIIAADGEVFDPPEANEFDQFQDFGHTHWHNSLIWGENLENVSIIGPGKIWGKGLTRGDIPKGKEVQGVKPGKFGFPSTADTLRPGIGNKSIALKRCRNVILRDFTILQGGHFGVLATGIDNLTIDNLKIDTNRDGMNIDSCRRVHVSNCTINSPQDDGICLKSSFGMGEARATENVTITNCQVSGYDVGSVLDGTRTANHGGGTGRIKFGTESNGGFKNITISNCTFEHCRGFALETVDGGDLEDVTITNITMRDVLAAPIFLRLGARLRGPDGIPPGKLRRITISNIVCYAENTTYPSIISGVPGHDVEDVVLSNIRVWTKGGGTSAMAAIKPEERERNYPEPTMFGEMPAYGLYARHVKGLQLRDVEFHVMTPDARQAVILDDVKGFSALPPLPAGEGRGEGASGRELPSSAPSP